MKLAHHVLSYYNAYILSFDKAYVSENGCQHVRRGAGPRVATHCGAHVTEHIQTAIIFDNIYLTSCRMYCAIACPRTDRTTTGTKTKTSGVNAEFSEERRTSISPEAISSILSVIGGVR